MNSPQNYDHVPEGWLAFELSVLRRFRLKSVANPYAGDADLDFFLKRWGVRVSSNDVRQWAWTRAVARVENGGERLTADDAETVLEDAYVPRHRLANPALRRWFNETDAWWFDNVRANSERLGSRVKRALALHVAMVVGDYVHSFDEDTRELRQPLSRVFERVRETLDAPQGDGQRCSASNEDPKAFLSREKADLTFVRLPRPGRRSQRHSHWAWREEWVRGRGDFWDEFEETREGRLGGRAATRQQYLHHLEDLLDSATHFPRWAIAHVENGFVSTEEIVESVQRFRRVGTIYTKDFTELMGVRAAIITT